MSSVILLTAYEEDWTSIKLEKAKVLVKSGQAVFLGIGGHKGKREKPFYRLCDPSRNLEEFRRKGRQIQEGRRVEQGKFVQKGGTKSTISKRKFHE